jgi:predicted methyltransferase
LTVPVVLSHFQANTILEARSNNLATVKTTIDLGLTESEIRLDEQGALIAANNTITWGDLNDISKSETGCFSIRQGQIWKIQLYSDLMNRLYSLMPTTGAPTMLLSGIPMHRIKGIDPHGDALEKIRTLRPIAGHVLDTSTGLGYTAIETAKTAERVITVEVDPAVLEICRYNPWSCALFENPRIRQQIGDVFDEITSFEMGFFSRIVHDPPTISLAGHLYSEEFYRQLFRVLHPDGRLFHYIGDLKSRSGKRTSRGVVRRLQDVGFHRVVPKYQAFGVVAYR